MVERSGGVSDLSEELYGQQRRRGRGFKRDHVTAGLFKGAWG